VQEPDDRHRLLCTRIKRPSCRCATQNADEVAPSHASPQKGLDALRSLDYAEIAWELKHAPAKIGPFLSLRFRYLVQRYRGDSRDVRAIRK
jgi:hypothetical protein